MEKARKRELVDAIIDQIRDTARRYGTAVKDGDDYHESMFMEEKDGMTHVYADAGQQIEIKTTFVQIPEFVHSMLRGYIISKLHEVRLTFNNGTPVLSFYPIVKSDFAKTIGADNTPACRLWVSRNEMSGDISEDRLLAVADIIVGKSELEIRKPGTEAESIMERITAASNYIAHEEKRGKSFEIVPPGFCPKTDIARENRSPKTRLYYIENTVDEWNEDISGYFMSLDEAKEALKDCADWFREKGTGRIYSVEFGLKKEQRLEYDPDGNEE